MNRNVHITLALLMTVVFTGCTTLPRTEGTLRKQEAVESAASVKLRRVEEQVKRPLEKSDSEVSRPWLAGKSVPLSNEVSYPPALRRGLTTAVLFKGSDSVDLQFAASQLTAALKIPVYVKADALLPATDMLPKKGETGQGQQTSQKISLRLPATVDGVETLNYVCSQIGASWAYKQESNTIEIYRYQTRVFEVRLTDAVQGVDLGLGKSGGQGQSFSVSASTHLKTPDLDLAKELKNSIDAVLTRGGTGSISGGLAVVTDTPDSLDRVAAIVQRFNRIAGRKVRMLFEAVDVSVNDTAEAGIDLDLAFMRVEQRLTGDAIAKVGMSPIQSLVSQQAGGASFGISGNDRFNGSSAAIAALSDIGRVVNHTKVPVFTKNRSPVTWATRRLFDYVAQVDVTTTASAIGTAATPSIKQKEETIGTTFTATPTAYDDGQLIVSMLYDATSLTELKPYTAGSSGGAASPFSTVQQRTIDGSGSLLTVPMRAGQTVLVAGLERVVNQAQRRRMDESAPMLLGGSDKVSTIKVITLLLLTAQIED